MIYIVPVQLRQSSMQRYHSTPADSRDDMIRRLRDELYMTRMTVLSLMKNGHRKILSSYYSRETRAESYGWESEVADAFIDGATILPREGGSYFGPRAFCPLCGNGSSSPYDTGFSVPEGLRRHLVGWGKGNQCAVFKVASNLAHEYWDEKFREGELREREAEHAREQQRKAHETLFLVDLFNDPQLIDASLGYGAQARSAEQLVWAEERLSALGFKREEQGRTLSYVDDRAESIVYADPRQIGEISFVLYQKPLPKKRPRGATFPSLSGRFRMADSWKIDLRSKYEKRVKDALAILDARAKR